ncbi:MULE transposase domain-containing protein [Hirschfeldia incana]|nr:MULE transposase domain-containing protein [Hirschfeldia incana]
MSGDTMFEINYDGKFENLEEGVTYVEGKIHYLETSAQCLFGGIISAGVVDMYGQRVWYKFPNGTLSELKVLTDGGIIFQNMCNATQRARKVEVYLEHEDVHNEREETESLAENVADPRVGRNEARENPKSDPRDEAVEEIVHGFVDEEEDNEALRDTPHASDDEDDIKPGYERWRRGSGELKIMQVFESIKEFKEVVLEYALMGGWNVKYSRRGNDISEAKCAVVGKVPCTWRIYCSYQKSVHQYMVKSFQEEHSCTKDGYCRLLTDSVIGSLLINEVRHDNALMPRAIQDIIQERYNLTVTHDIFRKARKRALDMISEEFDEQFARIKDYKEQILISNPESTVDLVTIITDDGVDIFDNFYVCFKTLKTIWRAYCRSIFWIDGCFMKSTSKGQLLAAVGRDANNQIYHVAWGIVQVEDADNWKWFIQRLKSDLDLKNGDGFTLISDKQKGLIKAVEEELPHIEHRMCARHIYGNIKKLHPNKPKLKKKFWAVANSFNEGDYKAALKELKAFDSQIYDDLMVRDPKTCTRAFFSTTSSCEDGLNNFLESYNSGLKKACSLPLVGMLEKMRRQAMVRIEVRKKKLKNMYLQKMGPHRDSVSSCFKVIQSLQSKEWYWKEAPGSQIQPPARPVEKGRKKNPEKRKKAIYESPTKGKKVSKHTKTVCCYRCSQEGHNSLYCTIDGVPNKLRKVYPRKKKTKQSEGEAQGPSQPSQSETPRPSQPSQGHGPSQPTA